MSAFHYVTIWKRKPCEKIARSASNANKNSQSTQPYPNTYLFQIAKVRDLGFFQNDENIIDILQIPIKAPEVKPLE